jgi:hypothetical protein
MRTFLIALVVLVLTTAAAWADDAPWKVGLAKRKITPQTPVYLAGYANRNKPFESVVSDLYAKALVLEDARGTKAALVTSDLIGFRAEFAEPIRQRIAHQTGIPLSHVLLNSSHTHTGPSVTIDESERWSNMTEEDARRTAAYTRELMDDVVEAVVEAAGKLQPAKLSHGIGLARFVMNRREATPTGVRLGFNPSGLADRSVPVLRIDAPDGRLIAVLFGAACHNTTLGSSDYFVSADYAGYAQEAIEASHAGATALFMIGCGGSANPFPRGSTEISKLHGRELASEVDRVLQTKLRPIGGPLRIAADMVDLPLAAPPSREQLSELAARRGGWEPWMAGEMLKRLDAGGELPKTYRCPVSVWQFGDDLTLVALSGEVVADYVPLIQDAIGPLNLWIAAYCNDVFGYVPASRTLREGGYETRGIYHGAIGQFAPETETILVNKIRALAIQAGRQSD